MIEPNYKFAREMARKILDNGVYHLQNSMVDLVSPSFS
jgi:hypothetical protein